MSPGRVLWKKSAKSNRLHDTHAAGGFGCSCLIFRPARPMSRMPLDQVEIEARISTRSMEAIQVQAQKIQHPVLKNRSKSTSGSNGLSPDEAAIPAVIANPKLRAISRRREVQPQRSSGSGSTFRYRGLPMLWVFRREALPKATVNAFNLRPEAGRKNHIRSFPVTAN